MDMMETAKNIDLETLDKNRLIDIQDVVIDERLPQKDRAISFIKQIKNPYCFKCGDVAVKIRFSDNGDTLENIIEKMLLM